jgi:hypothetical protein
MDYNTTRTVDCIVCGRGFRDDCGDSFCSSSCEREYESNQLQDCNRCGKEVHPDDLEHGLCEWCNEYETNMGDDE